MTLKILTLFNQLLKFYSFLDVQSCLDEINLHLRLECIIKCRKQLFYFYIKLYLCFCIVNIFWMWISLTINCLMKQIVLFVINTMNILWYWQLDMWMVMWHYLTVIFSELGDIDLTPAATTQCLSLNILLSHLW